MSHLIIFLLWATAMGFLLYLSWIIIRSTQAARLSPKNRRRGWTEMKQVFQRGRRHQTNSKISRIAYNNPFLAGAWHQLLISLKFDIPAAERLIDSLKRKYPGQNDRWYIEKAIHDIKRDNRY
ncbi:hypothetical protein PN488_22305 [Nodularia spumigena CS-591/12]|uniref:hypothetical protein n=1 Tax=Nodularia spumigena TaxID=70799 RepID=UPI002331387B|nr:hypothetical protein [Nodularia spumigena]MDB9307063.1 hypothetical protein [Nodularia spumigena CS-591/12]MDB9349023.1 hypothetical protein [Nodularia spumigena CS-588/01]MDB9352483.1 hypothetical protein [Nodularia spumigena CS-588/05]MDB9362219.1 hypothetical protein [Nodularia spumigena CS-588/02]MDB9367188.1 hypothetical protein [Nodularia spumigena CS-588/02A10]